MKKSDAFQDIPVVFITAKDKFFEKLKGKMAGSSEYLTKPFHPDKLLDTVNKYLQ